MILEEIFNGKFYPCETVVADSPRFKQAVKASAQCEESESHFKYGFSAGLLVQQEAHTQVSQKDKE